jgi:hypothetical protein
MFELQIRFDSHTETSRLTISVDETELQLIDHAVVESFAALFLANDVTNPTVSSLQHVVVSVKNI